MPRRVSIFMPTQFGFAENPGTDPLRLARVLSSLPSRGLRRRGIRVRGALPSRRLPRRRP